jgi:hypothetical protein
MDREFFTIHTISFGKRRITRSANFFVQINMREGTLEFEKESNGSIEFKSKFIS